MDIEFDDAKNAINLDKHGIALARTTEMQGVVVTQDDRFDEPRFRLYGSIDDRWYCAAVTLRGDRIRVISLRRAHRKEVDRYG